MLTILRQRRDALVAKCALRAGEVDACSIEVAVQIEDLGKDRTEPLPEVAPTK